MAFPTPYEDINDILLDLTQNIRNILGSQFVGLYLYGSLAIGDFNPSTSDVDFIVVTQSELSAGIVSSLRAMHTEFNRSGSPWSNKIEAAYITLEGLRYPPPLATPYPQVEKDQGLILAPLETGWAFQRHTLRESGTVIFGPNLITFTDPVDLEEMRQAAVTILNDWQKQAQDDPDWISWVRKRSCQAFVVLTICRLVYSLETGSVASKAAASQWMQTRLEPMWESLIRRALDSQQNEEDISDKELLDTLAFIDEALEQVQMV